jgi:hypothetical protein
MRSRMDQWVDFTSLRVPCVCVRESGEGENTGVQNTFYRDHILYRIHSRCTGQ